MNLPRIFSMRPATSPNPGVCSGSFLSRPLGRRFSLAAPLPLSRRQKSKVFSASRTFVSRGIVPPKARVLVLGSGRMGLIRCSILRGNPRFDVRGVVDTNPAAAKTLADKYGLNAYESLEAALDDTHNVNKPLDGIVLSTPTFTHGEYIRQAADAKVSVFTEKPVDETADKIQKTFEYAHKAGIQLCCGFQRRFDPSYVATKRALQSGQIGDPLVSNIFFADHPCPPKEFLMTGGNIFMDLSTHDVDFITDALQDRVISVYASGTSSDSDLETANVHDSATMVMKMSKGTVVTLFMSRSAVYGYDQRCEIFGTEGMVNVLNIPEHASIISNRTGVHHARLQHSFPQRFQQAFGLEMDAFADTLLEGLVWPVTAEQCIMVQQCADAARLSCETNTIEML